uniref:Uncharacterized protein n=1 Tax=Amphimedon queenslandica TaxID=400682 RepID=A0A1X7VSK2_AMPQE
MKEFLIVLLMSLMMGTVYFMPFHISLLGQFLSITNYVKQLYFRDTRTTLWY